MPNTNIEGLKQFLQDNPDYESVWFNENGDWCFSETTVFTICKTRDEILSTKSKSADKTNSNDSK